MSINKDLDELNEEDIDEDELLAMLSPEELKELQSEMDIIIAPDERVPVGQRQQDQTEKPPTGTFDHRSLVDYLYWEKESKRMHEEERVPATLLPSEKTLREQAAEKEDREKAEEDAEYKVEKKGESIAEQKPSTAELPEHEGKKTVDSASVKEPETQQVPDEPIADEPYQKPPEREPRKINKLNIPNLALGGIKLTSRPSGNETNLESTLDKMRNNNPSVTEVNLNNIENIPKVMLLEYVNALKKNRFVKSFSIANTGVDENAAFSLANMLRENRSVVTLNIESNFVTGKGIVAIIRCLQFNETLTELRFHNQRHMLGHHAEMEISRLLKANNTLLKMGYHFEQPGPRMVVTNLLTRNLDRQTGAPPAHGQTDTQPASRNQPGRNHTTANDDSIPKHPGASEPANLLQDVHLKRTPKKRDPFLDLDPREPMSADRASFRLKKTPRTRAGECEDPMAADERANLKDVIKTLKPVPRRREPAKVQLTPRDHLLSEIKHSNVAFLKAVPLPKGLESEETSLLDL
ncbi:hypothetical protein NHX12_013205 [Muraenolepis orangiensis]|uniref:Leiomodin-3 n=1 Tax=Muraenolepis orangiensis TaxID=630683 RepID=A0A9Q0I6P0_9TELE|nr:hypothetical protein NHX12_013205 [Muraenolepis orangiensis]